MIKGYSIHISLDIYVKKSVWKQKKPHMNRSYRYQKALCLNTGKTEDKNKL